MSTQDTARAILAIARSHGRAAALDTYLTAVEAGAVDLLAVDLAAGKDPDDLLVVMYLRDALSLVDELNKAEDKLQFKRGDVRPSEIRALLNNRKR